jgi:hypothetical protein
MAEAISAVLGGLGLLARVGAADLPAAGQADCLRALERAESMLVAARSAVLAAFTASAGYQDDGQYSPKTWLALQTRVTRAAAGAAVKWTRRLDAHPAVASALAGGGISGSWARQVCDWTDRMPGDSRPVADDILLAAQAGGATLADLADLAQEMLRRCAPPDGDGRGGPEDRGVILDTHFRGAGKLDGDLTPQCAAALSAVLESLGKKQGPEDRRTLPQRYHDALEEACRRLIAAGGLPDRAGQPTQIQLHMTLDELLRLHAASDPGPGTSNGPASAAGPGGSPYGRGRADGGGQPDGSEPCGSWPSRSDLAGNWPAGDGLGALGAEDVPGPPWLPGPAAAAGAACDATIVPVVTGRVDPVLLDKLAAQILSRTAAGAQRHAATTSYEPGPADARPGAPGRPRAPDALQTVRDLLLAQAVRLLSGPGGLAAALRAGVACPPAAAASLPLDIGKPSDTIPPHLRRAVIIRDRTCRFPGCHQPSAACEVHHVIWRSRGGRTQLVNLVLLCRFHHLIAIHEWGWTITLHADATVTAVSPDGTRTLHSHSPPVPAAA